MHSLLLSLLLTAEPVVVSEPVALGPGWFKPAELEKGCVGRAIVMPPGLAGSGRVVVKFAVQVDGTADRVEVPEVVPRLIAEAIAAAVKGCRFSPGRAPDGKRAAVWTTLPLRFEEEIPYAGTPRPAAAPPPPAGTPPREARPGCIDNQLHYRFPPNRLLHGVVAVRVAVSAEGKTGAFQFPPDLPDDVVNAFTLSIQDCPYLPATAPGGEATAGTFEYRINFAAPGDAERASGAAPRVKREARLTSPTCLQRLRPAGVIGHAVVQVTVTAEGEPTNFRLQPENTPASLRLAIFDVLSMCKWDPAVGLDDRPTAGDTSVTIRYR